MGEKIYTDQLAILSAKFLKNYCFENESCTTCVFLKSRYGCILNPDNPQDWEFEEIENRRSEHAKKMVRYTNESE